MPNSIAPPKHPSRWMRVIMFVSGMATTALLAAGVYGLYQHLHPTVFGDYPEQRVLSRVEGVDGPAIRITDDAVEVFVRKCAGENQKFKVTGFVQWRSVIPGGLAYLPDEQLKDDPAAIGVIGPGCIENTFLNEIPAQVKVQMRRALSEAKNTPVKWRITGREYAVMDRSQTQTWTTEPFLVVPSK